MAVTLTKVGCHSWPMETQAEDEDVVTEVEVGAVVAAMHMVVMYPNKVAYQHGLLQMPMMMLSPSHLLRLSRRLATRSSYSIMS